jgi:single-stranded-DNA-specific exonuclease
VAPLDGDNRVLVRAGLAALRDARRPGVRALLELAKIDPGTAITSEDVAFRIAPRINAPGRLGAAEPSLSLLLADPETAPERAQALEAANAQRRAIQDKVMDEALAMLGDEDPGPAVVLAGEGWPAGVVGIVAAKLVDRYQRPAFVIGIDRETGIGRGSARTCAGVNLYQALATAAPLLDRFGGHAAAAGFTIQRGAVPALIEALGGAVTRLAEGSGPVPSGRDVDAEVTLAEVDERLAQELAGLGPFGQENPAPLLVTRGARVTQVRRVGDGSHLKLTLEDDHSSVRSAIGFNLGDRLVEHGARLDLAFVPTISTWQGRRSAELEVADLTVVS